ncbi:MAG: spore coat associated protein CotJA [Clostridia bacterium]|nr:spore coat associated protein CotJA [Clostridia bacterium]
MTTEELGKLPLAMAYVPWQCWGETYDAARALSRGTIFPQLDLPFGFGG